jgi:hypothetical protein
MRCFSMSYHPEDSVKALMHLSKLNRIMKNRPRPPPDNVIEQDIPMVSNTVSAAIPIYDSTGMDDKGVIQLVEDNDDAFGAPPRVLQEQHIEETWVETLQGLLEKTQQTGQAIKDTITWTVDTVSRALALYQQLFGKAAPPEFDIVTWYTGMYTQAIKAPPSRPSITEAGQDASNKPAVQGASNKPAIIGPMGPPAERGGGEAQGGGESRGPFMGGLFDSNNKQSDDPQPGGGGRN